LVLLNLGLVELAIPTDFLSADEPKIKLFLWGFYTLVLKTFYWLTLDAKELYDFILLGLSCLLPTLWELGWLYCSASEWAF